MAKEAAKSFNWAKPQCGSRSPNPSSVGDEIHGKLNISAEQLRRVRDALGLSQPELGKLIGAATPTVIALEAGKGKVGGAALKLLDLLLSMDEEPRKAAVSYLIAKSF